MIACIKTHYGVKSDILSGRLLRQFETCEDRKPFLTKDAVFVFYPCPELATSYASRERI
jgi:hypothetical protein